MEFVKVCNSYFLDDSFIGLKELYVLTYLKYLNEGRETCKFRLKDFIDFVSESNEKVKYSHRDTESEIMRLKDKRSLVPVIENLCHLGLLEVDKDLKTIRVNDLMEITIKQRDIDISEGFEPITKKFMNEQFANLGYVGFGLYCFLKIRCFIESKNVYMSLKRISSYVRVDEKTISVYSELLVKLKLIKIKSRQEYNKSISSNLDTAQYFANEYYVFAKYKKDDRYFYTKPDFTK